MLVLLFLGNAVALAAIEEKKPRGPGDGGELAALLDGMGDAGPTPSDPPPTAPSTTASTVQASEEPGTAPTTSSTQPPLPTGGTGYTYQVTLEPLCVVVGQPLTASFLAEPGSAIGVIAAYADGQTHESRWAGNAGPDGRAVRTWSAPPAPGWAKLLTGAVTPEGESGGTPIDFQIVELPGECA